jgi:uncharacterized protein (TIGR03083 family)
VQVAEHIAALRAEGSLLARAAERAGPDAPVPSCPGWRVRDLVRHVGNVHRWATGYIAGQHAAPVDKLTEDEMIRSGAAADKDLTGWFLDGHQGLVTALERADPGMTCWSFLAAPSPLAFWARRQAHETAIHRVDAQLAAGAAGPGPFAPGLASDGIDELIMGFARRQSKRGLRSDPPCWLAVHARSGPARDARDAGHGESGETADWVVRMGTGSAAVARSVIAADDVPDGTGCDLTGPAEAVYLLLWNRGGTDGLQVRGDPRGLGVWREQVSVRWS